MATFEDISRQQKRAVIQALKGSREPAQVQRLLSEFYAAMERNIAGAIVANQIPVQCSQGCFYCCLLKVDAKAHEVFAIVAHIEQHFSADALAALKVRLQQSADAIAPLSAAQHLVANIPCGLLVDNGCSVYAARPALCRKFHSTSAALCKASYERPADTTIPSSEDEGLDGAVRAAIGGFEEGLKKSQLDTTAYEINRALCYALQSGDYQRRWRRGNHAFPADARAKTERTGG